MPEQDLSDIMATAYRELEARAAAGASLHALEDYIASLRLPEEERNALELWAWTQMAEPYRRSRRLTVFEPLAATRSS
jgi:hypothetical protein